MTCAAPARYRFPGSPVPRVYVYRRALVLKGNAWVPLQSYSMSPHESVGFLPLSMLDHPAWYGSEAMASALLPSEPYPSFDLGVQDAIENHGAGLEPRNLSIDYWAWTVQGWCRLAVLNLHDQPQASVIHGVGAPPVPPPDLKPPILQEGVTMVLTKITNGVQTLDPAIAQSVMSLFHNLYTTLPGEGSPVLQIEQVYTLAALPPDQFVIATGLDPASAASAYDTIKSKSPGAVALVELSSLQNRLASGEGAVIFYITPNAAAAKTLATEGSGVAVLDPISAVSEKPKSKWGPIFLAAAAGLGLAWALS